MLTPAGWERERTRTGPTTGGRPRTPRRDRRGQPSSPGRAGGGRRAILVDRAGEAPHPGGRVDGGREDNPDESEEHLLL
ncbi:hypothetical protein O1L60_02950 [Streptomyces diastatochromogenes]|nr:hypothetical protein [Streptomyces diastatochromogenes]